MIRINLLRKQFKGRKTAAGGVGTIITIIVAAVVVAAAGGAIWTFRGALFFGAPSKEKQETGPRQAAAVGAGTLGELISEKGGTAGASPTGAVADVSYNDLPLGERVGYEVLFAKNVMDLVGKAVPAGVGIRTLAVDDFQTVYAVGLAPSRALVEGLFVSLRNNNVDLLPKPLTRILPNGDDGFRFVITGKPAFGHDRAGAPLPSSGDAAAAVREFEKAAKEASISFVKKPVGISAEKAAGCVRHVYRWSGRGSYRDFVGLVDGLYRSRQRIAFKNFSLTAGNGSNVAIESQLIVTTRE